MAIVTITMPGSPVTEVVNSWFNGNLTHASSAQLKTIASLPIMQTVLEASPESKFFVVGDSCNITFTLTDEYGNPLQNQLLTFLTTVGSLSDPSAITDINGQANVTLTMTNEGTTVVSASFGGYVSGNAYQPSMVRVGVRAIDPS